MTTSRPASTRPFLLATSILALCLPVVACAQHALATETLPDAPGFLQQAAPAPTPIPQGTAAITGTVLDITGITIPHALVTLTGPNQIPIGVYSDNDGFFSITGLPAGTFNIIISSPGLETLEFPNVHLAAGEQRELPRIAMPLTSTSVSVTVVATPDEIANEQIKAEEKQRVLGVLPNFYTTYIWNAAPLKAHHKFTLAFHSFLDPVAFAGTAVVAGIEQSHNTFPGYGSGPEGYAKRYGAAFADQATGRLLGSAVFPSIFHQDPRYFYRGSGTMTSRTFYALSSGVICRGDNGHRQLNYSRILGSLAASGIANLYRSSSDRTVGLTFRNTAIGIAAHAGTNVIREFISRRISTNVPDYAKGKPAEIASDKQ
jgi:hypothetical protein